MKTIYDVVAKSIFDPEQEVMTGVGELPPTGSIFKEGYLLKQSRSPGTHNWRKRFFILECLPNASETGEAFITYADASNTLIKRTFILSPQTSLTFPKDTPKEKDSFSECISINNVQLQHAPTTHSTKLVLCPNDSGDLKAWKEAISLALQKLKGEDVSMSSFSQSTLPITRFHEGTLYKLTRNNMWKARKFELVGSELRYYRENGEMRKFNLLGKKIEPKKCDSESAPTKYLFRISGHVEKGEHGLETEGYEYNLNLAARNQEEYVVWLKVITRNLKAVISTPGFDYKEAKEQSLRNVSL